MFTIKTLVGRKYGMWLHSEARFSTADAAQAEINDLARRETIAGSSAFVRRVVAL